MLYRHLRTCLCHQLISLLKWRLRSKMDVTLNKIIFTNYKCFTTVTPSFVIRGCYLVSFWIRTFLPIGPNVIPATNATFDVVFRITAFDASGVYIFRAFENWHLKNFVNILNFNYKKLLKNLIIVHNQHYQHYNIYKEFLNLIFTLRSQ